MNGWIWITVSGGPTVGDDHPFMVALSHPHEEKLCRRLPGVIGDRSPPGSDTLMPPAGCNGGVCERRVRLLLLWLDGGEKADPCEGCCWWCWLGCLNVSGRRAVSAEAGSGGADRS